MKTLTKVWNWLDGNKTVFGTALAVLYSGLVAQGLLERVESVEWLILTLTGVGVAHKVKKTKK